MKKKNKDLFERLAQSRRDKSLFSDSEKLSSLDLNSLGLLENTMTFGLQNSSRKPKGERGTLERFADDLYVPVDLLIKQFHEAGISELTPSHRIRSQDKEVLLTYLRAKHGIGSQEAIKLYESKPVPPVQIQLIQDINEEILFLVSKEPALMYQLAPRKFEEMVARLFEDRGYTVTLTPQTRDGGCDLFAEFTDSISSFLVVAECKRYAPHNKVGVEIVRGLYGVTEARRANQGLVITSSFFTKDAQEEKRMIGARIGLKDYNDLVTWLKPYSG